MRPALKTWLDSKHLTIREFAKRVGLAETTAYKLFDLPDRKPRRLTAQAILRKYPDCPIIT